MTFLTFVFRLSSHGQEKEKNRHFQIKLIKFIEKYSCNIIVRLKIRFSDFRFIHSFIFVVSCLFGVDCKDWWKKQTNLSYRQKIPRNVKIQSKSAKSPRFPPTFSDDPPPDGMSWRSSIFSFSIFLIYDAICILPSLIQATIFYQKMKAKPIQIINSVRQIFVVRKCLHYLSLQEVVRIFL